MSRIKNILIAILLLLAVGCTHSVDLEDRWLPLQKIREGGVIVPSGTNAFVIGESVFVKDLEEFLSREPWRIEGTLRHEQVHAIRQIEYGLEAWLVRYLHDTDFMWQEEKEGWKASLGYYMDIGLVLEPQAIAKSLSNYRNLTGQMITYEKALQWANHFIDNYR